MLPDRYHVLEKGIMGSVWGRELLKENQRVNLHMHCQNKHALRETRNVNFESSFVCPYQGYYNSIKGSNIIMLQLNER